MERLTAEIIREAMIGMTSGHMAAIPNSPVIYSMFDVYKNSIVEVNNDYAFIKMLEEMTAALKD